VTELLATYRLQLGPGLDFARVLELVPYLRDLGISHLYLSPSLQARSGSTHGYDVVDPTRISDDLGGEEGLLLALDGVEDPQNLGAICRSAESAGATGVVLPERRSAEVTPAVCKASAGAVEHLLLAPVDDLAGALADLHVAGLRVVGAEADAALTIRDADLRGPIALVVGSEGQGLGPAVRRRCDLTVRIPMRGAIGSLNASVAGSILLFEAATQRAGSDEPPAPQPRAPLPSVAQPTSIRREADPPAPEAEPQAPPATSEAKVETVAGTVVDAPTELAASTDSKSSKAAKLALMNPKRTKPVKAEGKPAKAPKLKLAKAEPSAKLKAEPKSVKLSKRSSKAVKGSAAPAGAADEGSDLLP